ncbi:hypothetical protein TI04_07260 [Achromatium sp. WMS2]|nr:hypothetical protein TI04_07260 [Achromatium sp. WMS2]
MTDPQNAPESLTIAEIYRQLQAMEQAVGAIVREATDAIKHQSIPPTDLSSLDNRLSRIEQQVKVISDDVKRVLSAKENTATLDQPTTSGPKAPTVGPETKDRGAPLPPPHTVVERGPDADLAKGQVSRSATPIPPKPAGGAVRARPNKPDRAIMRDRGPSIWLSATIVTIIISLIGLIGVANKYPDLINYKIPYNISNWLPTFAVNNNNASRPAMPIVPTSNACPYAVQDTDSPVDYLRQHNAQVIRILEDLSTNNPNKIQITTTQKSSIPGLIKDLQIAQPTNVTWITAINVLFDYIVALNCQNKTLDCTGRGNPQKSMQQLDRSINNVSTEALQVLNSKLPTACQMQDLNAKNDRDLRNLYAMVTAHWIAAHN